MQPCLVANRGCANGGKNRAGWCGRRCFASSLGLYDYFRSALRGNAPKKLRQPSAKPLKNADVKQRCAQGIATRMGGNSATGSVNLEALPLSDIKPVLYKQMR